MCWNLNREGSVQSAAHAMLGRADHSNPVGITTKLPKAKICLVFNFPQICLLTSFTLSAH